MARMGSPSRLRWDAHRRVLRHALNLLNVSPFWVQFVEGADILVAVLWDAVGQNRDDNLLTNT